MAEISTTIADPEGNVIETGTLRFVATLTEGSVLKSTEASITPGSPITLNNCTYKVYYTDSNGLENYIGEIVITGVTGDVELVTLL